MERSMWSETGKRATQSRLMGLSQFPSGLVLCTEQGAVFILTLSGGEVKEVSSIREEHDCRRLRGLWSI